jgi:phosphodiesterase/alkaline phosphatase D-like protein
MGSTATWKVIAADLPIGLVSEDAIAQGDGSPLGPRIRDGRSLVIHQACWRSQHGVDHG